MDLTIHADTASATARRADTAGRRVEADISRRIEQIREQLQRGDYPIDLHRLAEQIADEETARRDHLIERVLR